MSAPDPKRPKFSLRQKARARKIKEIFLAHFDNPKTELVYKNAFELTVAVLLSAQCTDRRVNLITPALFAAFPDPESMARADVLAVKELIKSVSFCNVKAKNIVKLAKILHENHSGQVPLNQSALKNLPGIGQKSANVVLIEFAEANLMAVDTHVFRTSHRLGLSTAKTAIATEEELSALFKTDLAPLHQAMVLFGRYLCTAQRPKCEICYLAEFCKDKNNFKPA